jgi:hypothetical protein
VENNFQAADMVSQLMDAYDQTLAKPPPPGGSPAVDLFLNASAEIGRLGQELQAFRERRIDVWLIASRDRGRRRDHETLKQEGKERKDASGSGTRYPTLRERFVGSSMRPARLHALPRKSDPVVTRKVQPACVRFKADLIEQHCENLTHLQGSRPLQDF